MIKILVLSLNGIIIHLSAAALEDFQQFLYFIMYMQIVLLDASTLINASDELDMLSFTKPSGLQFGRICIYAMVLKIWCFHICLQRSSSR
jgi:hypothetical protein